MFGKLFTVFEVKLLLAALLGRAGTRVGVRRGIAKNGSSELLVDEDAGLLLGHASFDRRFKAVIYHLLGSGDLSRPLWAERAAPPEHLGLE